MANPNPPESEPEAGRDPRRFVFPPWANYVVPVLIIAVFGGAPYLFVLVGFGAAPSTLNANYQPEQPTPYSHKLHVTELGMDCRYCHTTVEEASFAAIPSTEICMNCHHAIRKDSPKLEAMRRSFKTGEPVEWTKVHDLGDYAYFDHSAHVNKGVSCIECHGRVDRMGEEGVYQKAPLSMGWCLKCHRDPAPNLRPVDQVTNLMWGLDKTEKQKRKIGRKQMDKLDIMGPQAMQDCSRCHR